MIQVTICMYIYIYLCLCSKNGNSIYIYVCIYTDTCTTETKIPRFGCTKKSLKRYRMEPRRSKCQKHLEILHLKSLCLGFEPISLLEAPPHIRPSGKGKSSSKNTFGGYVSSQEGRQSWGVKRFEIIPNESRNKPWEVGHGKEMDVSENNGTPKSSILKGLSIINHPFWGTPIFGNTQMERMIFPTNFRGWQFASRASVSSKGGRNTTETTIQDGPKNQL